MIKKATAVLAAIALTALSVFSCVTKLVSAENENDAEYVSKLKAEYDPYSKTDVFELRDEGLYLELNDPAKPGVNFRQRHLIEKPFSLSFINPIYTAEGAVINGEYRRTSVQISLKAGDNTLRFNFNDSVGSGNTSVIAVLLYVGDNCYTFRKEIIGNMTELYEYNVTFDYNAEDMISTRVVNSVSTDIFKTETYDSSAFGSGVEGVTAAEKTETFKRLIKNAFSSAVYFEPYIQIWGDLGGDNSKRKLCITEHNGQRFDGGAAYEYAPYISALRQYAPVVENSSFRLCFTGDVSYLADPAKFGNYPGYMPEFYGMIVRDAVYASNIADISGYLAHDGAETRIHKGTGWNTAAISVGEAGEYTLRFEVTNSEGKSFTRTMNFNVVKENRLDLSGALPAEVNEGESVTFPEAVVVTDNVAGTQTADLTVQYAESEEGSFSDVQLNGAQLESAKAGVYKAVWTYGDLTVEKRVNVISKHEQIVGLQINKPPTKLLYETGEIFDDAGLMIQKKFANGLLEEIWGGFFVVTDKPLKITDKAVVIGLTENGVTAYLSIPVVVEEPVITELAVESVSIAVPCDLTYTAGEKADLTGLKIRVIFNDNTETIVDSGFTLLNDGALKETDTFIEAAFEVNGFALTYKIPIVVDGATAQREAESKGCTSALQVGGILGSCVAVILVLSKKQVKKEEN